MVGSSHIGLGKPVRFLVVFLMSLAVVFAAPTTAKASPGPCYLGDMTPSKLPNGVIRTSYEAHVEPAGLSDGTYQLVSGTWPPGISMDPTGVVSGKPTKYGRFSYVVAVRRDVVTEDPTEPGVSLVVHCEWTTKGAIQIRSPLGARLLQGLRLPRIP